MTTHIKIGCVASTDPAHMARAAGANALGLVAAIPSRPWLAVRGAAGLQNKENP